MLQVPRTTVEETAQRAKVDISQCTRWMLDRQTTWIEDEEEEDDDEEEEEREDQDEARHSPPTTDLPPEGPLSPFGMSTLQEGLDTSDSVAGFCGRCGKIADTCYCFWNVGALAVSTGKKPGADSD